MANALILSSHVAASRVGGTVQALALAAFRIDTILIPTVLYGRHPGWGAPGGALVPVEAFEGMLDGVEANNLFPQIDLVLTGYFAGAAQVRAAARAIDAVRAAPRVGEGPKKPLVIVDPVMGDTGKGLYVGAEVAAAIAEELTPRADIVTPNSWELERLSQTRVQDPASAVSAAHILGKPVLVSSVPRGSEIGVVYADRRQAWLAAHAKAPSAPNGSGDLLTALFAASLLDGQPISYAMARAVGGVAETIAYANSRGYPELPVSEMGGRLKGVSTSVRMERLA
jgi:pyridoxine kinase